ncbi:MAG: homoserine dehydrogenase [Ferrovum sp.]|jgi:predicted dinucleotide-utilizing enzyme|nr:homoserine dehydrogenase [Ferrovum sp.]NDU90562.1 homoserine dehydrogenase [Ferrovum sp.]
MKKQKIAIVGLGRVGSVFLEALLSKANQGLEIVAVVEKSDTPGCRLAQAEGIEILDVDGLVGKSGDVDIIFDLTGVSAVRQELREKLLKSTNRHTVIATESIARMIWIFIADTELPDIHAAVGY